MALEKLAFPYPLPLSEARMNIADLEYLLQRTYLQGRVHSAHLINRENALSSSTAALLSKTAPDALESQRKLVELGRCLADTIDQQQKPEEYQFTADALVRLEEEFALMLAKSHKLPAVTNNRFSSLPESSVVSEIEAQLAELLSPDTDSAVASADALFAQMHEEYLKSTGKGQQMDFDEEVVDLAQKVRDNSITNMSISSTVADSANNNSGSNFMTAKQALVKNANSNTNANNRMNPSSAPSNGVSGYNPAAQLRRLGLGNKRPRPNLEQPQPAGYRGDEGRDINTEFSYYNMTKTPIPQGNNSTSAPKSQAKPSHAAQPAGNTPEEPVDERLANIEPRLIEMIRNEIMSRVDDITWDDIAGLEHAKKSIFEIVIWPMLKPDIFKGLLRPPKGVLLFGPPGTGKTMIGKCIAGQAKATFFSISASSLTSKWVGEGEKMVRALFAVARCHQPSVIFIDEIDSLLTQRTDGEVEASRRIKTEFLVQFDGAGTNCEDRILVIGATNRPHELDEAARRRLVKRLYIPLPDAPARISIIRKLMSMTRNDLSEDDIAWICEQTDGYSGADVDNLCREAALGPVRSVQDLSVIQQEADLRPVNRSDFADALTQVRASVSNKDLELYLEWNEAYGSLGIKKL